ncbi:MAG: hypothetical protein GY797_31585 [Deltaproteobacteria bacterium]|nr:hypothetical protein [Deltaproteobacteria bacterium]
MYCLVPEKPLRLFIPLLFSGGIWAACGGLLSTPRSFPAGTIGDTFYETVSNDDINFREIISRFFTSQSVLSPPEDICVLGEKSQPILSYR